MTRHLSNRDFTSVYTIHPNVGKRLDRYVHKGGHGFLTKVLEPND